MKVMITGGSGFIGSALASTLLNRDHIEQLIIVDVLDKPSDLHDEKVHWIKTSFIDIPNNERLLEELKNSDIDVLFHLATTMFPKKSIDNPVQDLLENGAYSVAFCQSMYNIGVKKIVYASSGGLIYGDNVEQNILNENSITNPKISYGLVKKINEDYLRLLSEHYNSKFISMRISNPYGIKQNKVGTQGVIPIFTNLILNSKEINLSESEFSCRDYIYIDDLISAFEKTIYYHGKCSIFNISSGISYTLFQLIEEIEKKTGRKAKVNKGDSSLESFVKLTNDKAREELNWSPRISLSDGISLLVDNFENGN
ncbi:UDP-N-acetylglucosamine 4-epimerase [Vibrio cholerae]|nr:dTDP-4-dehydro-6-deoxyglucose reductase [Vibrio cholerae]GHW45191.1 UDP-N-acetylglucosamine 4-epimerase [Vibrio cholerae]